MPKQLPNNNYQDLERLYRGRSEDVSRLEQRPSGSRWRRLLIVAFFILVVASLTVWAGFYAFGSWQKSQSGGLDLSITSNDSVPIGEPLTYHLTLTNHSGDVAQNIQLRLNYPQGFIWQNATLTPTGDLHNTWTIPSLAAGEAKGIDIQGTLLGESGSIGTIFATASYQVPNFRAELQASTSASTKLDDSLVHLQWTAPNQVAPNTDIQYQLQYSYDGTSTLPDATLEIQVPDNFTVSKVDPQGQKDLQPLWPVLGLVKGTTTTVSVTGQWSKDTNGQQTMKAVLQSTGDTPLPIASSEVSTLVSGGDLVLHLQANGADTPTAAALGSSIAWTLSYQNTGNHTLSNIEVRVPFDADLVDWSKVTLDDGGQLDNQTVHWTSAGTPALQSVPPKATGTLHWTTPVVAVPGANVALWSITATPSFEAHTIDGTQTDQTYSGPAVTVPVSTQITVSVEARYFDDDGTPLGQGPLPPKVDVPTTYHLRWKISDVVHKLSNVVVEASLPSQVSIVPNSGISSTGTLTLSDPHHPQWSFDTIDSGLEPSAEFAVTLLPGASDVGRILVLSGKTTATATDEVTHGTVSAVGNTATTNLDTDAVARGKGVVEK